MNNIERAADVVASEIGSRVAATSTPTVPAPVTDRSTPGYATAVDVVEALTNAGLLITDEDQAVLDAADRAESRHSRSVVCGCSTCIAVRARRETQR